MDCPDCGEEMDHETATGTQRNALGARVDVAVAWDVCQDCGVVVDDLGNVSRPEDRGPPEYQ